MKKTKPIYLLGAVSCLIAIVVMVWILFWSRDDSELMKGTHGKLEVDCIKTDETVTLQQYVGEYLLTNEFIVYECIAKDPKSGRTHPLNIDVTLGADLYLYWMTCRLDGLKMKATVEFNDTGYDVVLDESLECIADESI